MTHKEKHFLNCIFCPLLFLQLKWAFNKKKILPMIPSEKRKTSSLLHRLMEIEISVLMVLKTYICSLTMYNICMGSCVSSTISAQTQRSIYLFQISSHCIFICECYSLQYPFSWEKLLFCKQKPVINPEKETCQTRRHTKLFTPLSS